MGLDAKLRRRWFGAVALAAAAAMLIAGETVLKGRLSPGGFLVFWLISIALTLMAIVVAFRDVRSLRDETLQEQKNLLQRTLDEIQSDAKQKPGRKEVKGDS